MAYEPRIRAGECSLKGCPGSSSQRPRAREVEALGVADVSEAHDRELVDRLRHGDEDAFRGLFGRYAPSAKALALRVVRQSHLAEEIVQEAFLAVWRTPDSYDDERGSVRSWLMGMVHHRAVDLVRREEAQRRRAELSIPEPSRSRPTTRTRSWSSWACRRSARSCALPWTTSPASNATC